ncbi:MAG: oxidoreductase family protein [Dehalococcoidia bacterium]
MTTGNSTPTPEQVTADWLTEALRSTGTINASQVTSFEMKRNIAAGAGFMGELTHVTLEYDAAEPDAPKTLIAKFPARQQENRDVANLFRFYERETRFYEEIAHKVELRTPHVYYSAFDPQTSHFVLLIEDLAWAILGDQMAGCAVEQAHLCVQNLAKFHATWWDSPAMEALDWMPYISDPAYSQAVHGSYQQAWPAFQQVAADKLTPSRLDIGERFGKQIIDLMNRFGEKPRTIVHGDFRLDNLFFGKPNSADPLTVIDWQISSRARGVFDLAYFTCGTMPPEERRRAEMDLLKEYHGILVENGVRGYDFDACFADYRASVLFCLVYAVIGIGNLDLSNERGVGLFFTIMERTYTAIEDLNAQEFLPASA